MKRRFTKSDGRGADQCQISLYSFGKIAVAFIQIVIGRALPLMGPLKMEHAAHDTMKGEFKHRAFTCFYFIHSGEGSSIVHEVKHMCICHSSRELDRAWKNVFDLTADLHINVSSSYTVGTCAISWRC